jgi:rhodanese-related sulfurtransferase/predicted metal-dependent enzyme (double-stranded beta helix superfamily)
MDVHPSLLSPEWLDRLPSRPELVSSAVLSSLTSELAQLPEVWRPLVRHDPDDRWYALLARNAALEVWLIGWAPGQWTLPHDHGDAGGALTVAEGRLVEEVYTGPDLRGVRRGAHAAGESARFSGDHVHRVGNESAENATSIHAYSPPGLPMRHYAAPVAQLLERSRARLARLQPYEAAREAERGALLVDIRPHSQRCEQGEVPGAIVIDRNVLEWRLDPSSRWRIPDVRDYTQPVILLCSEGYASSLAAATLQELGLVNATDVEGGFHAWAAAGMPIAHHS